MLTVLVILSLCGCFGTVVFLVGQYKRKDWIKWTGLAMMLGYAIGLWITLARY